MFHVKISTITDWIFTFPNRIFSLSSPKMNAFNLLCDGQGWCPHVHLIHSLTGGIGWSPAQQDNLLQVLHCVVLHTHKAERIDHAVAHGNALNNVEGHQGVLLAGDECWMEISQDSEAVVGCPAQDVCCQDAHQDHHCLAATTQPLPNLLRLETWNVFEPELTGNTGITHCHDNHRCNKLQCKNKQEIGSVVGLLVHGPNLSTEDFVSSWSGTTMRVHGLRSKVCRGDWYQNGNNPDSCYQAVGSLELHTRPQRMDYSHVPGKTQA